MGLLPISVITSSTALTATRPADFCSRLGHGIEASAGAHIFCEMKSGQKPTGLAPRAKAGAQASHSGESPARSFGSNVDAGNPPEDQTSAGVQAYGQSETSIAAAGPYVVEAWNDATGFLQACPDPSGMFKEELIGWGFSANRGASFTDKGGLPNGVPNNCDSTAGTGFKYVSDPSVEALQSGGAAYFYVSGLYVNPTTFVSAVAVDACKATGSGSGATISCAGPFVMAQSNCITIPPPKGGTFCDFLDKDFLTIDPVAHKLHVAYTAFRVTTGPGTGEIDLASCDITSPMAPVCGAPPAVVAAEDPNCENEGAYPAVHLATGDVYVAWEFNWATGLGFPFGNPICQTTPTKNMVARVMAGGGVITTSVPITSMEAAFVPGYNRSPMNDFPRIAVSDRAGTVSIVWNDAGRVQPATSCFRVMRWARWLRFNPQHRFGSTAMAISDGSCSRACEMSMRKAGSMCPGMTAVTSPVR